MKKALLSLYHYFCFFLLMAFVITCTMLLFLSALTKATGLELTRENVSGAAWLTFGNVVLLSLACTVIDAVRRKLTVDRPVGRIVSAAQRITKGDFSVRIPALHSLGRADGLDEITDAINTMAQQLGSVETLQTDFIANVSHELKTPLAVMQNYGTLLQKEGLPEEERIAYGRAVSEASRRLAGLVTNILKLNKLENQKIFPVAQRYDLSEQLCKCLLEFENVWEEKEIQIQTDIQEDVFLEADPALLSLVWNNLLSNAFKFTDRGGTVGLTLQAQGKSVTVTVSDTGCGISPEVGEHLFEKFYQGDTSHATQGNGLGLALVKRVVDILGGEISVGSSLGQGSAFTVRLRGNRNG